MSDNSNYPPGTWEGDPRAPWNQPDPWEGRTCGECSLTGKLDCGLVCLYGPLRDNDTAIDVVEPDAEACEGFEG
jgi:hypothetical protein